MKRKTTVHKDLERRELTIERIVGIPPKLAWEGWTKPDHITKWWGPKFWTTSIYEMDVRPGGVWRYCLRPDDGNGEDVYCRAVYQEVSEPSRLVYIDTFTDRHWKVVENSEMFTNVIFEAYRESTRISIITRFGSIKDLENAEVMGMVKGYTDAFDRLDKYIDKLIGGK